MKVWKVALLLSFVAATLAAQQNQLSQTTSTATAVSQESVNAQMSLVRILSPVANQQVGTTFVNVSYELVNPGVSGGQPAFLVQLDSQDPVSTNDTQCTFTGLNAGQHTIMVQMVDANGTPITGGRSLVTFYVASSGALAPSGAAGPNENAYVVGATKMSSAASPLPLLSVVGFGVLLGGVAPGLRTRG